jgi:TATA-binding protein-associated factor
MSTLGSSDDPANIFVRQALFRDMSVSYVNLSGKRKNPRPWDMPKPKGSLENTIFGEKFLTVVIDEAHYMRNKGNKHTAALCLLQQATVRVIMTATPLHTSPKVSFW